MDALPADVDDGMLGLVDAPVPVRGEALVRRIAAEMADADPARSNDLLVGLLERDMAARARLVHRPIDVIASRPLLTDASRAAVPAGARLTEVDLGGHFFLREQPDATGRGPPRGAGRTLTTRPGPRRPVGPAAATIVAPAWGPPTTRGATVPSVACATKGRDSVARDPPPRRPVPCCEATADVPGQPSFRPTDLAPGRTP